MSEATFIPPSPVKPAPRRGSIPQMPTVLLSPPDKTAGSRYSMIPVGSVSPTSFTPRKHGSTPNYMNPVLPSPAEVVMSMSITSPDTNPRLRESTAHMVNEALAISSRIMESTSEKETLRKMVVDLQIKEKQMQREISFLTDLCRRASSMGATDADDVSGTGNEKDKSEKLRKLLSCWMTEKQELEETVDELERELEENKKELDELEEALTKENEVRVKLEKKCEQSVSEKDKMQEKIKQLEAALQESKRENETLKVRNDSLTFEMSFYYNQIKALTADKAKLTLQHAQQTPIPLAH